MNTNEDLENDHNIDVAPVVKQEQTVSESDVRDIVKRFNECINKHTLDKIELGKKVAELAERIEDKQAIVRRLYGDRENAVMDIEAVMIKIEETARNKQLIET